MCIFFACVPHPQLEEKYGNLILNSICYFIPYSECVFEHVRHNSHLFLSFLTLFPFPFLSPQTFFFPFCFFFLTLSASPCVPLQLHHLPQDRGGEEYIEPSVAGLQDPCSGSLQWWLWQVSPIPWVEMRYYNIKQNYDLKHDKTCWKYNNNSRDMIDVPLMSEPRCFSLWCTTIC